MKGRIAAQRSVWYTAVGAGLVAPLVSMAAVVEDVWPPLKKASAANGATAGPPELIWNAGVPLPGVTTSVTVAVCVRLPPPVPVMVRVELPVGVVPAVEMVKKMQCGETAWS